MGLRLGFRLVLAGVGCWISRRSLAHLGPRRDVGVDAVRQVEGGDQGAGVFLNQDQQLLDAGQAGAGTQRHHRAVLGDVGPDDGHILALCGRCSTQCLERIADGFGVKGFGVEGQGMAREQPGSCQQSGHDGAVLECLATSLHGGLLK